jgi:hypothetical protein
MTPIKTLFEIITYLQQSGKIQTLKDFAKTINRNYSSLSTIQHKRDGVTDKLIKIINETYKTDFVQAPEEPDYNYNCAEIVNKQLCIIEELQKQNSLLINKILQLGI